MVKEYINIALSSLALLFLVVIFLSLRMASTSKNDTTLKICKLISILVIFFLGFDIAYNAFLIVKLDDQLIKLVKTFYFICNILVVFGFTLYVDYVTYMDKKRLKTVIPFYSIALIINLLLIIVNLFTNIVFDIDNAEMNVNIIGMWVFTILTYSYGVYLLVFAIINRKRMSLGHINAIIVFILPPLISGIMQIVFAGYSFIFSYAISFLIIYAYLQTDMTILDFLTGAYNRRYLDIFMGKILKDHNPNKFITGLMIDIDNMKGINDKYGHTTGDYVIKSLVSILRQSVDYGDIISRYAGDEFFVVIERDESSGVEELLEKIEVNRKKHNLEYADKPEVRFSIGFHTINSNNHETITSFIEKTDAKMYSVKQQNKGGNNGKTN